MRSLLPSALLFVLLVSGCDTAPDAASQLAQTSPSGVLASYDVSKAESADILYNVWQDAGQGTHSVAFLDAEDAIIVEYLYVVGLVQAQLYARWPGVNTTKGSLSFRKGGQEVYAGTVRSEKPKEYILIGTASFGGTSIHIKPDEIRVDNDLGQQGGGMCTPRPDRRQEVLLTVPCTDFGIDFDAPVPSVQRIEVRGDMEVTSFVEGSVSIQEQAASE